MDMTYIPLVVLLCLIGVHDVTGQCTEDPVIPASSTRLSSPQSTYALDDPVVYSCDQEVGWGYIVVRCKDNGWGDPDRECEDQPNIEAGFISGLVLALFTMAVTVIFIIVSQMYGKKKDKEAACANAAAAGTSGTANGDARKDSMPGGLKPVVANHRRGSVAHILD